MAVKKLGRGSRPIWNRELTEPSFDNVPRPSNNLSRMSSSKSPSTLLRTKIDNNTNHCVRIFYPDRLPSPPGLTSEPPVLLLYRRGGDHAVCKLKLHQSTPSHASDESNITRVRETSKARRSKQAEDNRGCGHPCLGHDTVLRRNVLPSSNHTLPVIDQQNGESDTHGKRDPAQAIVASPIYLRWYSAASIELSNSIQQRPSDQLGNVQNVGISDRCNARIVPEVESRIDNHRSQSRTRKRLLHIERTLILHSPRQPRSL